MCGITYIGTLLTLRRFLHSKRTAELVNFKTPFTRYSRLSIRLLNGFDNRVERTAVRSTGCQTGLYNRFDNTLYRVNGA